MTVLWKFTTLTPELAYIIGAYITDGYVSSNGHGIAISVTSQEFRNKVSECLQACNLPVSNTLVEKGIGRKLQYMVSCYSTMFTTWLSDLCQGKNDIPNILFDTAVENKLAFLAGVIDGDGHVTNIGAVRVRCSYPWIQDLEELLDSLDIRNTRSESLLPSGAAYIMISIRRSDYVALGGTCYVPEKADRLINARDLRQR